MFAINSSTVHSQSHVQSSVDSLVKGASSHVDHACQAQAKKAGVPGTFVATVTTPHQYQLPLINSKVLYMIFTISGGGA